nr:hypothetical protein [Saprospiraceae bacterium]
MSGGFFNETLFNYNSNLEKSRPVVYKLLTGRYLRLIEAGLIIALVISILFKGIGIPISLLFIVILFSLLAFTYFIFSVFLIRCSLITPKTIIFSGLSGALFFIHTLGINYKLFLWEGHSGWLTVGIIGSLVFLPIAYLLSTHPKKIEMQKWRRSISIRLISFLILTIFFY